ncbi:MAG: hypothetical protein DHS80DRAFT_25552 [Piptocephalis tieghemiana]|nr:MAG: hypothetical protein DHS80DRAFT_25552 [Piptocephalis tieghemiana]
MPHRPSSASALLGTPPKAALMARTLTFSERAKIVQHASLNPERQIRRCVTHAGIIRGRHPRPHHQHPSTPPPSRSASVRDSSAPACITRILEYPWEEEESSSDSGSPTPTHASLSSHSTPCLLSLPCSAPTPSSPAGSPGGGKSSRKLRRSLTVSTFLRHRTQLLFNGILPKKMNESGDHTRNHFLPSPHTLWRRKEPSEWRKDTVLQLEDAPTLSLP